MMQEFNIEKKLAADAEVKAMKEQINNKTDKTYVDAQLIQKVAQSDLLAQKARIDTLVTTSNNSFYQKCLSTDTGALLVVSSGATTGQINLASVTPSATGYTPISGDYVRLVYGLASGSTELIDARVGNDGKVYTSVGNALREQVNKISNLKFKFYNLFNKATATLEKTLNSSGVAYTSAGMFTSDFIDSKPSTVYKFNLTVPVVCYYDSNKTFVSYVNPTGGTPTITTPSNAYYIRFAGFVSGIDRYVMTDGNDLSITDTTLFNSENLRIKEEQIISQTKPKTTIITLSEDGSKQFTTLKAALASITDASDANTYIIQLYGNLTNVLNDFTSTELNTANYDAYNGFCGHRIKTGITLKGMNDENIVHGELGIGEYSYTIRTQMSTLNVSGTGKLENLTVTSKNIRYAVHDDFYSSSNTNTTHKNCKFICYFAADGVSENHGYGMGVQSGRIVNFENCYFKPGLYYHTNHLFTAKSVVNLNNCKMESYIGIGDMGSGQNDELNITNTKYSYIYYNWFDNTLNTSYIKIKAIGNSKRPITYTNDFYYISDEIVTMRNTSGATIPKGSPVKLTNINKIAPFAQGDNVNLFVGIALEDILNNEYGRIQTTGYVQSDLIGLTVVQGDTIGLNNGVFAVNTGNEIGKTEVVVNGKGYIKLK